MRRIAFVGCGAGIDPLLVGGTQAYIRRISEGLARLGHCVEVVVYGSSRDEIVSEWPFERVVYVATFMRALSMMRSVRYDGVFFCHFPGVLALAQFLLPFVRQNWGKVIYLSVVRSKAATSRALKAVASRAVFDVTLTASPRLRREHERFGGESVLLLPPVPDELFLMPLRVPESGRIVVAYIGRLSVDKGVDSVVAAFGEIECLEGGIVTEIYAYGRDAGEESLRKVRELPSGTRTVIALDGASRKGVPGIADVLATVDVVYLPYRWLEGVTVDVPLTALEAMAAGCVVLSTPVGMIPWVVGSPRFLVRSVVELCERLKALQDRETLLEAKWSARAAARAVATAPAAAADTVLELVEGKKTQPDRRECH